MKGMSRTLARAPLQNMPVRKQRVKVKNLALSFTGAVGNGWATAVAGDFPDGNILFLGATAYLQVTKAAAASGITATFTGTYALGTTPTADATLSTTDANLTGVATLSAATAGVSPVTRAAGSTAVLLDNTDGSLEINVNVTIDDASISSDTQGATVDGVIDLVYVILGDD